MASPVLSPSEGWNVTRSAGCGVSMGVLGMGGVSSTGTSQRNEVRSDPPRWATASDG